MRAAQKEKTQAPADPALQEALAKAPMNMPHAVPPAAAAAPPTPKPPNGTAARPMISVEVDWEHIPMSEGQAVYAKLKEEFDKAGKILNARSMEHLEGYTCFMCNKSFRGRPGFVDHSFIDPETHLARLVECCGELCVINYNKFRINLRLQQNLVQAAAERE